MKQKASKLDPHAQTMVSMELEGKTLAEMVTWLKAEGVTCSASTVSDFLSRLRQARSRAELLAQIASGAQQVKEVEKQFGSNPAPQLDTLIKLHRVLILKLSTQGNADPEMLKLADQLLRTAMDHTSGQVKADLKKQEIALADRRVKLLEEKARAFDAAKEVVQSKLSPEEQRERLKEILK